jgi:DNA-directed RNA polymerase subunit F
MIMKKIMFFFTLISLAAAVNAQPPAGDAKPGEWYGEKVSTEGAANIADVAAKLGESGAVDTKIKAKIVEVCPHKGCWLKLQVNDSTTAMVKMKDYGFFLPLAAKGKTVVIDGEVKMRTTSVAELQHYAEDAKKSKEEIAAITKPEKEIRVTAKGIVIVE